MYDLTKRCRVFKELNEEQKKIIRNYAIFKTSKKNEVIFSEGDTVENILVLDTGKIKINNYSADGKEYIFDILVSEDVYGENLLFNSTKYGINLIAITDVKYYLIPLESVKKIIYKYPEMALKIIEILSEKLENCTELNEILFEDNAKLKIVGYLLYRSKRINSNVIQLTREEIAANVNLRRETVSRKLRELKEDGLIDLRENKKISLLDINKLLSLKNKKCD